MADFVFVFLAVFTVLCALGTILSRNVVNGAMCLLLCLIGVAGLFVRLDAFLLAFLLLLVYAGAVVALFLFIIMLLDVHRVPAGARRLWGVVGGVAACALLGAGLGGFIARGQLPEPRAGEVALVGASLKGYAESLFTTYLLPVEVIGFLLLIAMIGVIVLSQKSEEGNPP
jgi:NADH-quinone oxidoreductase subunit J